MDENFNTELSNFIDFHKCIMSSLKYVFMLLVDVPDLVTERMECFQAVLLTTLMANAV